MIDNQRGTRTRFTILASFFYEESSGYVAQAGHVGPAEHEKDGVVCLLDMEVMVDNWT